MKVIRNAMMYKEQAYEAAILQKLREMEDFLKSFTSSLEGPLQKKTWYEEWVRAPMDGKILLWYKTDGREVKLGEPLCEFAFGDKPGEFFEISSPAEGILHIKIAPRIKVSSGTPLAKIVKRVRV